MTERCLPVSLQSDWKGALRAAGRSAQTDHYEGEVRSALRPAVSSARMHPCTSTCT